VKKSKYNFIKHFKNKYFIVNCLTSYFFELNKNQYKIYEDKEIFSRKDFDRVTFSELRKGKFLIPRACNELENLRKKYYEEQESKKILTVTIAPTLKCNFACRYCYEKRSSKKINENEQVLILSFIENELKKGFKEINLTWFGGEPLLAFAVIKNLSEQLTKLAKKYDVKYKAFITSNGYLLTENIAKQLKKLKINQVFVTLDGVGKIHDERRNLANGKASTFKIIVNNVKHLKKYGVKVLIRMNIDNSNQNEIEPLRHYVNSNLKLPMYLGLIRSYTESCRGIDKECFTKEEYSHIQNDFNRKQNLDKCLTPTFPKQLLNYCRACKFGTYVIDPNLDLFKCENDIGRPDKKIGNIKELLDQGCELRSNDNPFLKWNPFNFKKCNDCKILPICMGGCPYMGIKNNEPECEVYQYNFDSILEQFFLAKIKNS
jgi:uncharacterized protein